MQQRRKHVKDGCPENQYKQFENRASNKAVEAPKGAVGDPHDKDAGRFVESGYAYMRLGSTRTGE